MLYDPKWEKPKTEPLSLAGLVEWLERQPSNQTYNWEDCDGGCLVGLYGKAMNLDWHKLHGELFDSDRLWIASNRPHTFGAALARARIISR